LSDSHSLKNDLYDFQRDVLKKIPVAFEESPFFIDKTDRWLLTYRVFELVKQKWKQICENPELQKHIGKCVRVGQWGPFRVTNEEALGMQVVTAIVERQAKGLQRVVLRYDDKVSEDLADFFLKDEVTIVAQAPIYYLGMRSDRPIALEEGLQLVPASPISDEFILPTSLAEPLSEIRPSLILEHRWHEKKTITELHDGPINIVFPKASTPFREFVIILRLLGMSRFKAPFLQTGLLAPVFGAGYRLFHSTPPWYPKSMSDVDQLDEQMTNGLVCAWKELRQVVPPEESERAQWLAIALDRMNMACERDQPIDKLLDLCISLEALLTREPQQVTYQFRQRGTLLLSLACQYLSKGQLEKAKKFLGKIYTARSEIVHGKFQETAEVEQANRRLFELARIFSLECIALSHSFTRDQIIESIDLAMASTETRRELEDKLKASALAPFWNKPYEKASELFPPEPTGPVEPTFR